MGNNFNLHNMKQKLII